MKKKKKIADLFHQKQVYLQTIGTVFKIVALARLWRQSTFLTLELVGQRKPFKNWQFMWKGKYFPSLANDRLIFPQGSNWWRQRLFLGCVCLRDGERDFLRGNLWSDVAKLIAKVLWCCKNIAKVLWCCKNIAKILWCCKNIAKVLWGCKNIAKVLWCCKNIAKVLWCCKNIAKGSIVSVHYSIAKGMYIADLVSQWYNSVKKSLLTLGGSIDQRDLLFCSTKRRIKPGKLSLDPVASQKL